MWNYLITPLILLHVSVSGARKEKHKKQDQKNNLGSKALTDYFLTLTDSMIFLEPRYSLLGILLIFLTTYYNIQFV